MVSNWKEKQNRKGKEKLYYDFQHFLFQILNEHNLLRRSSQWETIEHIDILDDFPILSEEDIGDITLGTEHKLKIFLQF